MNRFKVYLVEYNINIEFSDGSFTGWENNARAINGFNNLKDAQRLIWVNKQVETKRYRKWLHQSEKTKGCFIHHCYTVRMIDVF